MKVNMNKEVWKQYRNTEYLISNIGNVWSNKSSKQLAKIDDGKGYWAVSIDGVKLKVHRLVAITFIPNNSPEALTVNHINGDKLNNNVENLEWLSHIDNMKHAWANNLCVYGEDHFMAKLTREEVVEIKKLFVQYSLNNTEIGLLFGVAKGTIAKIRSLHTWREVSPELVFEASSPNTSNKKKLSGEDIPMIREMFKRCGSLVEVGKTFGVHSGTISGIISGKTWKNY